MAIFRLCFRSHKSKQEQLFPLFKKGCSFYFHTAHIFWDHFPALYVGLSLLVGIAIAFSFSFVPFCLPLFTKKKKKIGFILLFLGYIFSSIFYQKWETKFPVKGKALIKIEQVKKIASPFSSPLVYEGTIQSFYQENISIKGIPYRLYLNRKQDRPKANRNYLVSPVTLLSSSPNHYTLKLSRDTNWVPIKNSYSFAEWRYQCKKNIRKKIKKLFPSKRVYSLISALVTGELDNYLLSFQFGRLGLQHLLVISGFHFALLSALLFFLVKQLFSLPVTSTILLLCLTLYFFYLGSSPSIDRAWKMIFLFLCAKLLRCRFCPLNALGISLLSALLSQPSILWKIGFQLSFAATIGILLLYSPIEYFLRFLFPKRTFLALSKFSLFHQIGYLILAYLRQALALYLAVMTFLLPLLLFHFHTLPLLSLPFSLFFPPLFSLLLFSIPFCFLFPILSGLVGNYAVFLLDIITYLPHRLEYSIHIKEWTLFGTLAFLTFTFSMGMIIWRKHFLRN